MLGRNRRRRRIVSENDEDESGYQNRENAPQSRISDDNASQVGNVDENDERDEIAELFGNEDYDPEAEDDIEGENLFGDDMERYFLFGVYAGYLK